MCSCASRPKGFTYLHNDTDTGLDTLIDTDGYYTVQRACDSTFHSLFMFYPNGLFTIATTSEMLPELIDCFENGGRSTICKYPLWGTYRIEGDVIKTQVIRTEGNGCVIFRDYKIGSDRSIINISDYVHPENTNLGYMANYPSFTENPCPTAATFHPSTTKRDIKDCPLLKKRWFSIRRSK